jgi:outer membrane protein assembly factor BamB
VGPSTNWPQWGQNPQHHGFVDTAGQPIEGIVADVIYDPFVPLEQADSDGDLLVHYQVPLIHENDVFMMFKTGNPQPPPNFRRNDQIWNEKRLHWEAGSLVEKWTFQSDWKPEPAPPAFWEPVFHPALSGDAIYVPGAGGSVFKLNQGDGTNLGRISPFGALDPNTFVAGPITSDDAGNILYHAIQMRADRSLVDSWLVRVSNTGDVQTMSFTGLIPDAPTTCIGQFGASQLPWPKGVTTDPASQATTALPNLVTCGDQRPGINIAPAIAPDGTIYTATRAHYNSRYSYLVALNPDLTLKWASSLRDRVNDGCGFLVQIATQAQPFQKSKCRWGATPGVDPQTNQKPAGRVLDDGTASPTVLPDGSVIFGAYSRFNIARGHLYKFSSTGAFQAAYDFGWDDTLGVYQHDGTYSIIGKDNHYDEESGFYCYTPTPVSLGGPPTVRNIVCDYTGVPAGPFYITQLDPNLVPEWKFWNRNTKSCSRNPDGTLTCVSDHPGGFEWCVNAPAIDGNGTVYANSEDGNLYAIEQGHTGVFTTLRQAPLFQQLAVGAAYTPASISPDGKIYSQNDGHLFVVGRGGKMKGGPGHGGVGHGPKRPPDPPEPTDDS